MTQIWVFIGIWLLLGTLYGLFVTELAKVASGSLIDFMEEVSNLNFQDKIEKHGKQKVDTALQISLVLLHSFFWVFILAKLIREA